MDYFVQFVVGFFLTFIGGFIAVPVFLGVMQLFGMYTIVEERRCKVYVLFGKVLGVIDEPGLHLLLTKLGVGAFIVNIFGQCYELDMRLDQEYLRSQPVNSEEGAPIGIGIWYEMYISDPVNYIFKKRRSAR